MKKLSVLVSLALLAVAGTGFAVTCAYDNVPGATLLVPYFRVGGAVSPGGYVTATTDTKVAFVNVSTPGIIAHVTVWNKYSKAVLDFNVPMTGKDVVTFNMSNVLNGLLNVNPTTQSYTPKWTPVTPPLAGDTSSTGTTRDLCGVILGAPTTYDSTGLVGWGQTQYLRFAHPESVAGPGYLFDDWPFSVSLYTTPDAFSAFRIQVMTSLDESGDIMELQSSAGAYILDTDNPACGKGTPGGTYTAASPAQFSGYLTIDVVNYCTNWFPNQTQFYQFDAIATAGWGTYGYTPNVLIGDVFYVDPTPGAGGNISGDPTVNLEFDTRLNWSSLATSPGTFYGRFVQLNSGPGNCERTGGCAAITAAQAQFVFGGDGREPLGDHYGLRYFAIPSAQVHTWLLVWRGDLYNNYTPGTTADLCRWLLDAGRSGYGFYDTNHAVTWLTYDEDENLFAAQQQGGPSGGQFQPPPPLYIFLEASRIALMDSTVTTGNTEAIPGWNQSPTFPPALRPGNNWFAGWMDILLRAPAYDSRTTWGGYYNQGWIGVQHSGPGSLLSVGHAATNLNGNFQCNPAISFANGIGVLP